MNKLRVWYDYKRACYVSNVGFVLGKQWGVHPFLAATYMAHWLMERYPEVEAWAS